MIVFIVLVAIAAGVAIYSLSRKQPHASRGLSFISAPSVDTADAQVQYDGGHVFHGPGSVGSQIPTPAPRLDAFEQPYKSRKYAAARTSAKTSAKVKPVAKKKPATKATTPKKKAAKTPVKRGVVLKKKATAKARR